MRELLITNEMRERINSYLGYELIKPAEIGHHIYDEAPGLGKIGIEGTETVHVVTNKQMDSSGNIEWFKAPSTKAQPGDIKTFHCKLASVSAKKAKILIASLFPEEAMSESFHTENKEAIDELRRQLALIKESFADRKEPMPPQRLLMGPNDMLFDGAVHLYPELRDAALAMLQEKEMML